MAEYPNLSAIEGEIDPNHFSILMSSPSKKIECLDTPVMSPINVFAQNLAIEKSPFRLSDPLVVLALVMKTCHIS